MAPRITFTDLKPEGKRVFKQIADEYAIDTSNPAVVLLLKQVALCHDRITECRQTVEAEGLKVLDRFEQQKPHPLLAVERDARAQMLAALRALDLELHDEPKRGPGRPPGS
jgi:hypothetical protein